MPTRKSFDQIKAAILKPAMTSQFQVFVTFPQKVQSYLQSKDINLSQDGNRQDTLNLSCVEASLPGSSLATLELTSDHTGVTERHVHRRMFDDRIDFTFLVDSKEYLPIRAFEYWKEFITQGNESTPLSAKNHFYRMNYPDHYVADQGLKVVKFERDFDGSFRGNNGIVNGTNNMLTYNFVRAFPIAISSMPVSYDTSSLLKCTVSMSYIRYYLTDTPGDTDSNSPEPKPSSQIPDPQPTPSPLKKKITGQGLNELRRPGDPGRTSQPTTRVRR